MSVPLPPLIRSPTLKLPEAVIVSSPSPVLTIFVPPVNVIASLPLPPVMVFEPVLPIVSVRFAEAAPPFTLVILVGSVPKAIVPEPKRANSVKAPPEFEITTKLILSDVTLAVVTPVPAISINTFSLGIEVEGPTSSRVKFKEVIPAPCAITIPPSPNNAAAVSPSVMLSKVSDCP